MVIRNAKLDTVCGVTSKLPQGELPEIAFAGKSNVGKSSLINALMNRKELARTSSQPGKTRTVNFYAVDAFVKEEEDERTELPLTFVDLPGYGYAKVSKSESEKWGGMIENYLNSSKALRGVFLLLDLRHEPSANDRMMYDWINAAGFEPIIIGTKSDKLKRSQMSKQISVIRKGLGAGSTLKVLPFSALSKDGRDDIYREIIRIAST
ncbi:MAG: YihA family ribosome biogenesis GTP-binding protein [Lachnospiraceae bacterium]|nr:YihA family ribosome biogenesis GTP-binding protein [Lachnospiraceae bacterium]MBR4174649.1 YihA family ribosome biogenesis GTP-binding protein [Lachnospiraceae bacterium]